MLFHQAYLSFVSIRHAIAVRPQHTATTHSSGASGPVTQLHSALSGSQQNHMPAGKEEHGCSQLRAKQGHFSTDRVHGGKHALRNWWFLCGLPLEVECSWPSAQVSVFSAIHIQFISLHSATLRPCTCVSPWCGGALPELLSLSFCTSNRSRFHLT